MADARLKKTRAAYACPDCDGDGRVSDYGEGDYECSRCSGSGIELYPKPQPKQRALTATEKALHDIFSADDMRSLGNRLAMLKQADRDYHEHHVEQAQNGTTIRVLLPTRFEHQ